jgi:hypothetical protein
MGWRVRVQVKQATNYQLRGWQLGWSVKAFSSSLFQPRSRLRAVISDLRRRLLDPLLPHEASMAPPPGRLARLPGRNTFFPVDPPAGCK